MPPGFRDEGLRAALEARERIPGLPVLVLSQYVEESYAAELLGGGASGVGYLLKDRVGRVDEFLDALERVASGGTALDPEVVTELMSRRRDSPLDSLTPREREVLKLMAEGRDNTTIADTLVITERSVSKHIGNVFLKLSLPERQRPPTGAGGAGVSEQRLTRVDGELGETRGRAGNSGDSRTVRHRHRVVRARPVIRAPAPPPGPPPPGPPRRGPR